MSAIRLTTDAYLRIAPVSPRELVFGILRRLPAPDLERRRIVAALYRALANHVRERSLGCVYAAPLDVVLDRERGLVLQPDITFFSTRRRALVGVCALGAPDLAIDLDASSVTERLAQDRVRWFAEAGAREHWRITRTDHELEIVDISRGRVAQRRLVVSVLADARVAERRTMDEFTPIRSFVLPTFHRALRSIVEPRSSSRALR